MDIEDLNRQLSATWLTQALSVQRPGVIVEQSTIVRVLPGTCAKVWIDMVYADNGHATGLPERMVAKSGFNQHGPLMEFTYRLEMLSYRDVVPRHPINSPVCYYAGASPDGASSALLLEDLNLKNVRFCHAQEPLNYEEAAAFIDALARFHASSWNHPSLSDGSWPWVRENTEVCSGLGSYLEKLLGAEHWGKSIRLPRAAAIPKIFHDSALFRAAFTRLAEFDATQPSIVMMGDDHPGNLYIETDGTPGFLDFQSRIGTWSLSIAYFLGAALDILDRRAWEHQLIAHYLSRLDAYGVEAPRFEEAWDAYCRKLIFGVFVWITNGSDFQSESVNTAYAARLAAAAVDNDTLGRLGIGA